MSKGLFGLTPRIKELSELSQKHNKIDKELFVKYDVKQGLRDSNGQGVLTGLTNISDVNAKKEVNGWRTSADLRRQLISCCSVNCRRRNNSMISGICWSPAAGFRRILCVTSS